MNVIELMHKLNPLEGLEVVVRTEDGTRYRIIGLHVEDTGEVQSDGAPVGVVVLSVSAAAPEQGEAT